MRAAYYEAFGGPENLQTGERPDPAPDAGRMLVRTRAAGVGIWDVGMMRGTGGQGSLPRIPGCEVAGTVEVAAGGFSAGDRVFCSLFTAGGGGFAELAAVRVDKAAVVPDSIDFPEAAGLVIPAVTAYEGLVERAGLQAGETVLITAASGGVGTAAVQIARNIGARVVAVASARNHRYLRDLGAEAAVDYHDPRFVEQLRSAVPSGSMCSSTGPVTRYATRCSGWSGRAAAASSSSAGHRRPETESISSTSAPRPPPGGWRRSPRSLPVARYGCRSRKSSPLSVRVRRCSTSVAGIPWAGW